MIVMYIRLLVGFIIPYYRGIYANISKGREGERKSQKSIFCGALPPPSWGVGVDLNPWWCAVPPGLPGWWITP